MKQVKYYPEVDSNIITTLEEIFRLSTNVRLKHERGFYFIVKVIIENVLPEITEDKIVGINQTWKLFIKEVDNVKNKYIYQSHKDLLYLNPIDPYQGEINNYDPKYRFNYYDPNWSIEEILEVNGYMKEFLNINYGN